MHSPHRVSNPPLSGLLRSAFTITLSTVCPYLLYFLSYFSSWLSVLSEQSRCLQEHEENNMHSSCGLHIYCDGFSVGFLYNLCWYFSDISPDTPSYTTRGGGWNNRVFVIVVIRNSTSRCSLPLALVQTCNIQYWKCFVSNDWLRGQRRCLSYTRQSREFLTAEVRANIIRHHKATGGRSLRNYWTQALQINGCTQTVLKLNTL
jgi:hypothetical protein